MLKRRITLAIPIANEGKAPSEIRLFAAGWNDTTKGLYLFDEAAGVEVMRAFKAYGNRLTWYFGHPELDGRKAEDCKSAGSFLVDVRDGEGGVECLAVDNQWAEGVAEAIERKEWLYCSPGFWYDENTRRVLEITNSALTNAPATKNARPLLMAAARMEALGMSHDQIRGALQTLLHRMLPETENEWNWLREIWDDKFVFERSGKLYQINYAIDASGAPQLVGGPIEVMIAYQPVVQSAGLGVVPYRAGPIDDTAGWSSKAAEKSVRDACSDDEGNVDWKKYGRAFCIFGEDNPESTGSYRLIHHEYQQGELVVSKAGVIAAAAILNGARGGIDLSEVELGECKKHIGEHMKALGLTPPWDADNQSCSRQAGANGRSDAQKRSIMDKAFLAALGLAEGAPDTEALAKVTTVQAHLGKVCQLTGKADPAEALGVITSWKEASDKLPGVQEQLATEKKTAERNGIVAMLNKAAAEKRLTPDEHKTFLADYDAGDLSAAWLNGRVPSKPVNQVLAGAANNDAAVSSDPASAAVQGKTWEQLSSMEKHDLYNSNRPAYEALKAARVSK
jgi:phage I-like protein